MKKIMYSFGLLLILGIVSLNSLAGVKSEAVQVQNQATQVLIDNLVAGGLENAIKAKGLDPLAVVDLKITGQINGTDVRLLRAMAGSDEHGEEINNSALENLDLGHVDIVAGGEYYIIDDKGDEYYTKKNELSKYIFYRCISLKKFTFPNSAIEFGMAALSECKNLGIVNFSATTKFTKIPALAFKGNPNLGYDAEKNEYTPIVLPNSITKIEDSAFDFCGSITEIKFPERLESIGANSFASCDTIQSISFPNTLRSIGMGAFYKCKGLKSLQLPESLESIGDAAFQECININSDINIPATLIEIGSGVFYNANKITGYYVDNANPSYTSTNGVLYNKDKTILFNYPAYAKEEAIFRVPPTVTTIELGAFHSVLNLKKLFIPKSVTTLENQWCSFNLGIEEIEFEAGSTIEEIGEMHFCFNLKKVTLPTGLKAISKGAFEMCTSLSDCPLPASLKAIYDMAFAWSSIKKLDIPKTLNYIGARVYFNCHELAEITVDPANTFFVAENNVLFNIEKDELLLYPAGIEATSYTIPANVKSVANGAFASNNNIIEVTVPATVSTLGTASFFTCSGLKKLNLPDNLEVLPEMLCGGCFSMTSANIPKNVISIGDGAFALSSYGVAQMVLDEFVSHAITEAETEILITEIEKNMPQEPTGKATIGDYIVFPNCLTDIGAHAFKDCDIVALETLNPTPLVLAYDDVLNEGVFDLEELENATLIVPKGTLEAYKEAEQWNRFGTIKETPSGVNDVDVNSSAVVGVKGGLKIETTADIAGELKIYTATGALNNTLQVKNGDIIPAERGIYIVTFNDKSSKVIVY